MLLTQMFLVENQNMFLSKMALRPFYLQTKTKNSQNQ